MSTIQNSHRSEWESQIIYCKWVIKASWLKFSHTAFGYLYLQLRIHLFFKRKNRSVLLHLELLQCLNFCFHLLPAFQWWMATNMTGSGNFPNLETAVLLSSFSLTSTGHVSSSEWCNCRYHYTGKFQVLFFSVHRILEPSAHVNCTEYLCQIHC